MSDQNKKQGSGQNNWGQQEKQGKQGHQGQGQSTNKEAGRAGKPYSSEEQETESKKNV